MTLVHGSTPGSWDGATAARPPVARKLEARIVTAIEQAGDALGWDPWRGPREVPAYDAGSELLELASLVVQDRLSEPALKRPALVALCGALVELEALRREVRDVIVTERISAFVGLQAGLGRMRGVASAAALLDRATVEVCNSCGFDRSVLFRVLDSQMVADSAHFVGHDADAAAMVAAAREEPADLNHLLLETEMIRRRMPMLVLDAQNDERSYRSVVEHTDTRSYVAAPIMPEGRVIGFLHADRYYQRRHVDEFDRDVLWAFAEGFGYAYERTVLHERLRAQRDQVRGMVQSTEQLINELCDTEMGVAQLDRGEAPPRALSGMDAPSRLDQLLTRREIEVIRLMAAGETNAGIAQRLVISEGTVKSHVKHILRKLRAANRAEAVSRFLRISALNT
ncbi:MAG: LuxR family transcriptional regulator, regulator of acetate metabolism [Solirubrobacteraceae bacterium]|nr:LuxR family transcriptional regulator, regulator of acetate metabolism [Solirubrobacteraceae bacterium]